MITKVMLKLNLESATVQFTFFTQTVFFWQVFLSLLKKKNGEGEQRNFFCYVEFLSNTVVFLFSRNSVPKYYDLDSVHKVSTQFNSSTGLVYGTDNYLSYASSRWSITNTEDNTTTLSKYPAISFLLF